MVQGVTLHNSTTMMDPMTKGIVEVIDNLQRLR